MGRFGQTRKKVGPNMINSVLITSLYLENRMSIRGICKQLNLPDGERHKISSILRSQNIEVHNGFANPRIGDVVEFTCPDCGRKRSRKLVKTGVTIGRCHSCANKLSHRDDPRIPKYIGHWNWKGGIREDAQGYLMEYVRKGSLFYSMAQKSKNRHGGVILQHRLVMARHLGRILTKEEIVHHVNGDKKNNKIDNLRLTTRGRHPTNYIAGFQEGYKEGYEAAMKEMNKRWTAEGWG